MPSSHHTTLNQQRLALIHSIMHDRPINVGHYMRESILDCAHRTDSRLCLPFTITSLCRCAAVPEVSTDKLVNGRGWTDNNISSLIEVIAATPINSFNPAVSPADSDEEPATEPAAATAPTDHSAHILAAIQRVEERQMGLMTFIRDFTNATVNFITDTLHYTDVIFPTFPAHYFHIPSPTPTPPVSPHTHYAASTPSPARTEAANPPADSPACGTKWPATAVGEEEPLIRRNLEREFTPVKRQKHVADRKLMPKASTSTSCTWDSGSSSDVQLVEQTVQPPPQPRRRHQIRVSSSSEDSD
ncbi:hypothetical protein HRI_003185400 [Hibiscus trionum]|uniref:Putative plant transposon protein domain-containing protein n=1 Tax=Hibiscus trionum TaxID=183268 RepID=A0A9W7IH56_HIBTR|nr:hypothetical protein HRI_003185400 [Hibiscus trionum]